MKTYIAIRGFDDDLFVGTEFVSVDVKLTQEQVTDMINGTPVMIDGMEYFIDDLHGYTEIGLDIAGIHRGLDEGGALIVTEAEIPKMLHVRVEWRKLAP
jgi:hypothetical protein